MHGRRGIDILTGDSACPRQVMQKRALRHMVVNNLHPCEETQKRVR